MVLPRRRPAPLRTPYAERALFAAQLVCGEHNMLVFATNIRQLFQLCSMVRHGFWAVCFHETTFDSQPVVCQGFPACISAA
jgi:hypothetical protein